MTSIMERLHWLGQSCFVVEGNPRIYFDPFDITATKPADIILVSHTHRDHYSPPDIKRIATKDTTLVITADAQARFSTDYHHRRAGRKESNQRGDDRDGAGLQQ